MFHCASELSPHIQINRMSERTWVTDPDEYVCTLSEDTQKLALEELREDPKGRDQALSSMREWIKQNPRILNCRLGQ